MLSGSQRELNIIDDQSGEGYVLIGCDAKAQTTYASAHLNWRALPVMFVNNSRWSHQTWCAEGNP
jgi:hypothetical protein